jgi:hypothetical protein
MASKKIFPHDGKLTITLDSRLCQMEPNYNKDF